MTKNNGNEKSLSMNYKLSSSKLNLLESCPRCFWMSLVKKVNRPSGPMASIPIKMDSIIKNYFNKYRSKGELPPIIQGKVSGKLAINMPKTLKHQEKNGIILWGRPDEYLEFRNKKIAIFDHKTKSKEPTDIHPAYRLQMNVYSYLLKEMGYKTMKKAFIAYYYPDYSSDLHNGMILNCTLLEMDTNPEYVKDLIKKAYDVLNGPIPNPSKDCDYCRWMQTIAKNNFIPGGIK